MKDEQASLTALTVLQGIVVKSQDEKYKHLVSAAESQLCEHILSSSTAGKKKLQQVSSPFQLSIMKLAENILMPGISLHYVLRKRYIEQQAREAIKEGFEQIVSLGAGFDSLCWRLSAEHPEINYIEIDHPASSALKQEALQELGSVSSKLHFLEVDFSQQTLLDALQASTLFDPGKRTLFICEGVMMYLKVSDVSILMESILALGGQRCRFVFTAVSPMNSPNNNTGKLLKFALKFMSEPLDWLIESSEIEAWLSQHKYTMKELADTDVFKETFLSKDDSSTLHIGEYIVVAEPG